MTLEDIEQTYIDFANDVQEGNYWYGTYRLVHDTLSWYNIKTPKALERLQWICSDNTMGGDFTNVKQANSIYNAINKLKKVKL